MDVISGRGASLINVPILPVVNSAWTINLIHNGLHYEPVFSLDMYTFWSQIQLYLAPEFNHRTPNTILLNFIPSLIRTQ